MSSNGSLAAAGANGEVGNPGPIDGLFREFLDKISDCVSYYDHEGVLLYSNERARQRFPLVADKLVPGCHVQELLEAVWDRAAEDSKPGSNKAEWVAARLDLHWKAQSSYLTAVEDGQWIRVTRHRMADGGILVIHSDETTAMVAEQRAEAAISRLSEFVNSVDDGMAVFDSGGRLVITNSRMAQVNGPLSDILVPGVHYEEINRALVDRGIVLIEKGKEEEWLANRLRAIENRDSDIEHYVNSGNIYSTHRYPTADGGFVSIRRNISAAVEAERRADEVAQRFADFVNDVADGVAVYDAEGRIVLVNQKMLDGSPSMADLLVPGVHYADITRALIDRKLVEVEPGHEEEWIAARVAAIENRASDREFIAYDRSWYSVDRYSTRDGGFFVIRRNISDLVEAERQAKQATTRLEDFLDGISDGVALYDADGRLVMCNEANKKVSKSVADLLVPGAHYEEITRAMVERGGIRVAEADKEKWIEDRLKEIEQRASGQEFISETGSWVAVDRYPTSDGGFLTIRRDMTKLKEAEASMRSSERTLGAIINAITDRVTVMSPDGRVVAANRASLKYFSDGGDSVIDQQLGDFLSPERRRVREEMLAHVGRTMAPMAFEECHEGRWYGIVATPIANESGELNAIVAVARDITDAKLVTESLAVAKQEAERASQFKSEFLANMSHEFRTPLNAIMGFSEALLEGIAGPITDDRQREYLTSIQDSSEHLARLVDDLLDISAIEAGRLTLNETVFDPVMPVHAAMAMILPTAEETEVSVSGSMVTDHVKIEADHVRIRQVLVNLLSNAVKYAPNGHVSLSGTVAEDGGFDYVVRDDGPGMSPAQISDALTRFGRAGGGSAVSVQGTGIGLPLSKALVEAHGGKLRIENGPGAGTIVTVHLPASRVYPVDSPAKRSMRG